MEKNIEKNVYIYVKLNHFAVQQKLIQHCKSAICQLKKKNLYPKKKNKIIVGREKR